MVTLGQSSTKAAPRDKVTRGGTKDLFRSGLKNMKKTFDIESMPATFHFIGSNSAFDKNQKPHRNTKPQ
jgi:hypothetical protein